MIGSATDIIRLRRVEMMLERANDDLEARDNARTCFQRPVVGIPT
jgi:hypothetical protein